MHIFLQLESKILYISQINISVYSYIIDQDFLNIVYFKIIWFSKRYYSCSFIIWQILCSLGNMLIEISPSTIGICN